MDYYIKYIQNQNINLISDELYINVGYEKI